MSAMIHPLCDLFDQRPDVVKQLLSYADSFRKDLGELGVVGQNVRPVGFVEEASPRLLGK